MPEAPTEQPGDSGFTSHVQRYVCDSGAAVTARYPDADQARLRYQGSTYALEIAISASGARYVGDDFVWWTKGRGEGSEATLYEHLEGDTTGPMIERCRGRAEVE